MLNEHRWIELLTRVSGHPPEPTDFALLAEAYSETHRRYHNSGHIEYCLAEFDLAPGLAERPDEVEFAIWLHDAFYDPKATDNEERSACRAREILLGNGAGEPMAGRIGDLVLATKHGEPPTSPDARLLVDIDLSILGQPPQMFDSYEEGIRQEYSWVPTAAYVAGRTSILRSFLGRPRLYSTDRFERMYGLQAKANITRAILALEHLQEGALGLDLNDQNNQGRTNR